jgi:hypothetical protein
VTDTPRVYVIQRGLGVYYVIPPRCLEDYPGVPDSPGLLDLAVVLSVVALCRQVLKRPPGFPLCQCIAAAPGCVCGLGLSCVMAGLSAPPRVRWVFGFGHGKCQHVLGIGMTISAHLLPCVYLYLSLFGPHTPQVAYWCVGR